MSVITSVFVFANGFVAVCDQDGEQMPEYQGSWREKRDVILRDKPAHVVIQFQDRRDNGDYA